MIKLVKEIPPKRFSRKDALLTEEDMAFLKLHPGEWGLARENCATAYEKVSRLKANNRFPGFELVVRSVGSGKDRRFNIYARWPVQPS